MNVFSERGIYGGNQLGVVFGADNLNTEEMQQIARQFNYSESTFITNYDDKGADVKIFLPDREIPFAGHPTIGTAYILEKIWRDNNPARSKLVLNLKLGSVEVTIENDEMIDICTMDQFPPILNGEFHDREYIAEILGIEESDIMDLPLYKIAPSDLPFIFVPVKSAEVMRKLKPNMQRLVDEFDIIKSEPYVFTMDAKDGGDVRARLYAPKSGIVEDPATGSAQASLAMALHKLGLIPSSKNGSIEIITEQGYEMGRPSKLYNTLIFEDNSLVHTRTGGRTYLVSKGKMYI